MKTKTSSIRPRMSSQTSRMNAESPVSDNLTVAQLHAEMHGLIMMPADDHEMRQMFRKRISEYCDAVGVANLYCDDGGAWDLKPGDSTGRVPRRNDFVEKFAQSCQATIERNTIQLESFLGLQAIFVPVKVTGRNPEVILILTKESDYQKTLYAAEIIAEYFGLWLKESSSDDNAWKLNSLAALVELVSAVEKTDDRQTACQTIANEIVRYLGCDHAAVGLVCRNRVQIQAISGQNQMESNSEFRILNETAISESLLRNELACWNEQGENGSFLLTAHEQLGRKKGFSLVISTPLKTPSGQMIGVLLVASKRRESASERVSNFLRASAPRMASALEVVGRAEVSRFRKGIRTAKQQMETLQGRIWIGLAAVIIGLLLVPVPYRVRCSCDLNSAAKQFAVAPFDGIVQEFNVRPGEEVKAGQLLVKMDGQTIRYRIASVVADLARANKQRDIELNSGNIPKSLVAELEAKSLKADQDLLRFNESQIEIRSPVDGVILADQPNHSDGTSVSKGEIFFEIGSLDPILIEVNIPAEEIANVKSGDSLKVWIDGFESKPISAKIQKLSPRSENRNNQNVFVAEIQINNEAGALRPGMRGHVRIDTEPKTLGWNLFHKPVNFLKSRLTWW